MSACPRPCGTPSLTCHTKEALLRSLVFQPERQGPCISNQAMLSNLSKQQHPGRVVYHVKDKLEEVDNDNFKMRGKFVEGGFLDVLAKSYTQYVHIKQGAAPNTCKVEWCIKFQPLSEQLKPQAIKAFQEYVPLGYKALEAYLLSHNDYK
ncbi:hypothetical protein KP509_19G026200 [Ceratopteris richardii]|uniref:Bet v I/Major latex protein domain-containing protein n=2 Tax=Ceratopteris richardii TaxID=49495 RepID=A0A8T2SKR8_CERRI|nr:hypothetical protein KP509_19G026200 [Ceratopteris richardii]